MRWKGWRDALGWQGGRILTSRGVSRGRLLLYFSSAVVFLVAGLAVFGHPPPLWVPALLGLFYFAVIVIGVMNLSWEMFGDAVCQVPQAKGVVALTFDDGPDPVSTPLVLAMLKEADARATFFVVGKKVEKYPEIVAQILAEGHSLGIHSFQHQRLYAFLTPAEVERDIERTRQVIFQACGLRPLLFRPPVGQMSPRTAAGVKRAQVETIGWSVRARDGLERSQAEGCLSRVVSGLHPGAIVLLHDAWESRSVQSSSVSSALSPALEATDPLFDCPAGVRVLREILKTCRARGLQPVTVEELLSQESAS